MLNNLFEFLSFIIKFFNVRPWDNHQSTEPHHGGRYQQYKASRNFSLKFAPRPQFHPSSASHPQRKLYPMYAFFYSDNVQQSAVIYTLKYARCCYVNKQQTKINALSEHLLNFLAQKNLDLSLRRHVAVTLQYILMKDRDFIIRNILSANFLDLLAKTTP